MARICTDLVEFPDGADLHRFGGISADLRRGETEFVSQRAKGTPDGVDLHRFRPISHRYR
jgi:hypothetical protein